MDFAVTFVSGQTAVPTTQGRITRQRAMGVPRRQRFAAVAERFEIRRLKSWCVMPDKIVRHNTTNCQLLTQLRKAVHKLKSAVK